MTPMEWTVKQLEDMSSELNTVSRVYGLMQRIQELRTEAGFFYGEELG